MFQEQLKELRRRKGFTQEELAARLHVARQTISKWEKGYSVPDAQQLQRLAEVLEADVAELLGGETRQTENTNEIAMALSRISEQMAIRNRRWRRAGKVLLWVLGVFLALTILGAALFSTDGRTKATTQEHPEMAERQPGDIGAKG